MQKKLLTGLFWVLLANLIVKPVWILLIETHVQDAVGDAVYGIYFALFNVSYIFNILLDLGITNFNTRNIASHPQLIGKHLSGILTIKILLLGLYMVVTLSVGLLLGYSSREFFILAWLCLNQFLSSLILYLRSNFEGLLLFRWDSVLSVLDRVLMILICGFLLFSSHFGGTFQIEYYIGAQTAAYLITAAVAFSVIARKSRLRRLRWNRRFMLVVLRKSAPFALLVLLMASYNRIDPILLRQLASDTDAGIYARAFRLLDALSMIPYLVSLPLLPVYARLCRNTGSTLKSEISAATRLVLPYLLIFAIGTAVILMVFAQPVMDILYDGDNTAYAAVFSLLIFCIIPISFTYVFGTLLTAAGHLRQLNIMALSALVLNILLNILLIPRFGALGSACASLAAQGLMAVGQTILACHHFGMNFLRLLVPRNPLLLIKEFTNK